jgi:hypothetical protein
MQERTLDPKSAEILILAFLFHPSGIVSRPVWYDKAFAGLYSENGLSAIHSGALAPAEAGGLSAPQL